MAPAAPAKREVTFGRDGKVFIDDLPMDTRDPALAAQGKTTNVVLEARESDSFVHEVATSMEQDLNAAIQALNFKGLNRFGDSVKRPGDGQLRRSGARYDRVLSRMTRASEKADAEGIKESKKKRLDGRADRLRNTLDGIKSRNPRLAVIMKAAPVLVKPEATYAETRSGVVKLGDHVKVEVKVEAPAKTPEEIIQLGLDAYRRINEFALPEGTSLQDGYADDARLLKAGKEHDESLSIYNNLPPTSPARPQIQRDIDALLDKNPRMKAILEAAAALGLKNPSFERAYERLAQLDAEDRRKTAILFEAKLPTGDVKIDNEPISKVKEEVTPNKAIGIFYRAARTYIGNLGKGLDKPFDDGILLFYHQIADALGELAKSSKDSSILLKQAQSLVLAEDYDAAKDVIAAYLSLGQNQLTPEQILDAEKMQQTIKFYSAGDIDRRRAKELYDSNNRANMLEAAKILEQLGKTSFGTNEDILRAGIILSKLRRKGDALRCFNAYLENATNQAKKKSVSDFIKKNHLESGASLEKDGWVEPGQWDEKQELEDSEKK